MTGPPAAGSAAEPGGDGSDGQLRVAMVMSRFPKLTETFVLGEILALRRLGVAVHVFPLIRQRERLVHPEARQVVEEAHYLPFLSPAILASNLWFAARRPRRYFAALGRLVRETAGSLNFLVGGIGIFPKVVHAARLMEGLGIDHVHCHFATHPALAGFVVHRLTGIPYSFTAHGSDLHVERKMLGTKVAEASFVVAISDYNRRMIIEECAAPHRHKVEVVHCGVDLELFQPAGSSARRDPGEDLVVLCVGTLHEVKGQAHLIDACGILRRRGVPVRCMVVGEGPDRDALARRAQEQGVADAVDLAGTRTREEVAELVRRSHVVAVPSVPTRRGKREGIPVVLMEAMASGTPVVASDLSGIPELVVHDVTGLLVPPGDAEALADELARLHRQPDLARRLARAGREKVEAEFELTDNARRLAELIRHPPEPDAPDGGVNPCQRSSERA